MHPFEENSNQSILVKLLWGFAIGSFLLGYMLPQPYATVDYLLAIVIIISSPIWRPEKQFHNAAKRGDIEEVQKCLVSGMNVDIADSAGVTALHLASKNGNSNVVDCLLSHGAVINKKAGLDIQPLHLAMGSGSLETISILLDSGAAINVQDFRGLTPLSMALDLLNISNEKELIDLVLLLTERNADPNIGDTDLRTSLHISALKGYQEISLLLIRNGANINARMKNGKTPLSLAIEGKHEELASALYSLGAIE